MARVLSKAPPRRVQNADDMHGSFACEILLGLILQRLIG
jgi:hypothetical protein